MFLKPFFVWRYSANSLFSKADSALKHGQYENISSLAACVVIAILTTLASPALGADNDMTAQEFDDARYGQVQQTPRIWQLTVGAGAVFMPEYEGSDKFEVNPLPIVSAKVGDRVSVDHTGVTILVLQHDGFNLGLKGGYEMGRKEDDSRYLFGFGEIDPGVTVGGEMSYGHGLFQVYANLDKTLGGSEGLTGALGGRISYEYERFVFSADISGTWADNKHMKTYFGVSTAQSARSGIKEYVAGTGFKRVDVKASATYVINENWALTGATGLGVLTGDARDSAIVKDGIQPFSMIGLAYQF